MNERKDKRTNECMNFLISARLIIQQTNYLSICKMVVKLNRFKYSVIRNRDICIILGI